MNEQVKALVEELGIAINESLTESPSIQSALARIRDAGHEIVLVLEATIALEKKTVDVAPEEELFEPKPFEINAEDRRFLKSLRIKIDDLEE